MCNNCNSIFVVTNNLIRNIYMDTTLFSIDLFISGNFTAVYSHPTLTRSHSKYLFSINHIPNINPNSATAWVNRILKLKSFI